jgi:hypothetical protein
LERYQHPGTAFYASGTTNKCAADAKDPAYLFPFGIDYRKLAAFL